MTRSLTATRVSASLLGTLFGLVSVLLLFLWTTGLSISFIEAIEDASNPKDDDAVVADLTSWRPVVPSVPDVAHAESFVGVDLGACDKENLLFYDTPNGDRVLTLAVAACPDTLAAYEVVTSEDGQHVDLALPGHDGLDLARRDVIDGAVAIAWREQNLTFRLFLHCAGINDCRGAASNIARQASAVGDGPRTDPTPRFSGIEIVLIPLTLWILLVVPVRLVQFVRRQRWRSRDDQSHRDVTATIQREHLRRGTGRLLAAVGWTVTTLGSLGVVFGIVDGETHLPAIVCVVLGPGALLARRRWLTANYRVPALPVAEHGARAWWARVLLTYSRLLAAGALFLMLTVFMVTTSLAATGLDATYLARERSADLASPADVARWSLTTIALGNRGFAELTILLSIVPALGAALAIRLFGRRLQAASSQELLSQSSKPPILYLRSFDEDRTTIAAGGLRAGVVERLLPWRRRRFEQVLVAGLSRFGDVHAVEDPRVGLPRLGAARRHLSRYQWEGDVRGMAHKSLVVVLSGTPGVVRDGLARELALLNSWPAARLIVVRGPYRRVELNRRWLGFVARSSWSELPCRHRLFAGLIDHRLIQDGTQVVATSGNGWIAYGARERSVLSYVASLDAAFEEHGAAWTRGWEAARRAQAPS